MAVKQRTEEEKARDAEFDKANDALNDAVRAEEKAFAEAKHGDSLARAALWLAQQGVAMARAVVEQLKAKHYPEKSEAK